MERRAFSVPNLVAKDGDTLEKIEEQYRAGMLQNIVEGHSDGNESDHAKLQEELREKIYEVLKTTIEQPLRNMKDAHYRKKNIQQNELDPLDLKLEEERAKKSCDLQNIKTAMSKKISREEVICSLCSFFDHIIRESVYLDEGSREFSIQCGSAVIEGIRDAILEHGTDEIEDNPILFETLNSIAHLNPESIRGEVHDQIAQLVTRRATLLPLSEFSNLNYLVDVACEHKSFSDEMNECINQKIKESVINEDWPALDDACHSMSGYISKVAAKELDQYFQEKYQLSIDDFFDAWDLSPFATWQSSEQNLWMNLEAMEKIESERPGITKVLHDEFNIREFRRYPAEILIEQFDARLEHIPYGLVLYTNRDHNRAFDMYDDVLLSTYQQLKAKGVGMRIMEFDSKYELIKSLARANMTYGSQNKLSYVILGAHGYAEGFTAGSRRDVSMRKDFSEGVVRIKDYFVENPEIVLASCSTGSENGIGQHISQVYDARVHAPNGPTKVKSINPEVDPQTGHVSFSVKFQRNGEEKTYYRGIQE
ncbi:MAG TPA: hypothetical protein VGE63_00095 [Candidatus Paceibacterota bacterium]